MASAVGRHLLEGTSSRHSIRVLSACMLGLPFLYNFEWEYTWQYACSVFTYIELEKWEEHD